MTPNEIANAVAVICRHMGMTPAEVARELFGVRPETLGSWRRGQIVPSRSTQAVLRLLARSIETPTTHDMDTAAIMAALMGNE